MKTLIYACITILFLSTAFACGKTNNGDEDNPPSNQGAHTITFTINGPELSHVTITGKIPNDEAFAVYTPTPIEGNFGIMFSAAATDIHAITNFIRKDNALLPLGKDYGDERNFNHSIIVLNFQHNGRSYTLQSESGTCTENAFEIHSTGSMASLKADFSGLFKGGPAGINQPQSYQVTGSVDIKMPRD